MRVGVSAPAQVRSLVVRRLDGRAERAVGVPALAALAARRHCRDGESHYQAAEPRHDHWQSDAKRRERREADEGGEVAPRALELDPTCQDSFE